MILKIAGKAIDFYNGVSVALHYDSVASSFAFAFYFDPENALHREVMRPCSYAPVMVEHKGETLITGTLLSHSFDSGPVRELVAVSGYSKTGVLEDCEIPTSAYPLQTNKLSLKELAERICKPFGIKVVVDASVAGKCSHIFQQTTAQASQTVKEYLSALAGQKHIILSHNSAGNLLLTQANTNAAPTFDLLPGMVGVLGMKLTVDGQRMHSGVTMVKQQTKGRKDGTHKKGNAGQSSDENPFVKVFRPRVKRQTSGKTVDTDLASRNMLSDELKAVGLSIELDRWALGGVVVRPNQIITVTNPDLYLYSKTRFFIQSVEYKGDNNAETATLTCVLPSVFGTEDPVNIFS